MGTTDFSQALAKTFKKGENSENLTKTAREHMCNP